MKRTRPELGLERVLAALVQDVLIATDDEIHDVATEMGLKPEMRGSIALAGVTFTARLNVPGQMLASRPVKRAGQRQGRDKGKNKTTSESDGAPRARRPKDDGRQN